MWHTSASAKTLLGNKAEKKRKAQVQRRSCVLTMIVPEQTWRCVFAKTGFPVKSLFQHRKLLSSNACSRKTVNSTVGIRGGMKCISVCFCLHYQSTSLRPSTGLKATCRHSPARTSSSSLLHRTPRARPFSSSWKRDQKVLSSPLLASLSGGSHQFQRRRGSGRAALSALRCLTSVTPRAPSLWR